MLVIILGFFSCFLFGYDYYYLGWFYAFIGAERYDDDYYLGCLVVYVLLKVFEWYKDIYLYSCIWYLFDYFVL